MLIGPIILEKREFFIYRKSGADLGFSRGGGRIFESIVLPVF